MLWDIKEGMSHLLLSVDLIEEMNESISNEESHQGPQYLITAVHNYEYIGGSSPLSIYLNAHHEACDCLFWEWSCALDDIVYQCQVIDSDHVSLFSLHGNHT